ncbi:MAG: head GIN domain-containing protein [Bacteroidota bacterium]
MKTLQLFIALSILISCGKESSCPGSTGEIIFEERILDEFEKISVLGDVELVLKKDSLQSVRLECGENLAQSIRTEVIDGELIVDNSLTCNWLRDLNTPIRLHISSSQLNYIYHEGQKDIRTEGSFSCNSFSILAEGSNSKINLTMNCQDLDIVQSASNCSIELKGYCSNLYSFNSGTGSILAAEMACEEAFVTNQSSGRIEVNALQILKAHIYNTGDIYYKSSPDSINFKVFHPGTGLFIPL